jgi:hypothetical protein
MNSLSKAAVQEQIHIAIITIGGMLKMENRHTGIACLI